MVGLKRDTNERREKKTETREILVYVYKNHRQMKNNGALYGLKGCPSVIGRRIDLETNVLIKLLLLGL